jgi:hypothetical protein
VTWEKSLSLGRSLPWYCVERCLRWFGRQEGKVGATRAKTEFLTKIRLEQFISRNLPNCWLVTMTFHENVIVKKEAMGRWKPVADWLKRHGIDWCGVWQQQKRGAWHHHFLINKYINVVGFREFVVARGWGQTGLNSGLVVRSARLGDWKRTIGRDTQRLHPLRRFRVVSETLGL